MGSRGGKPPAKSQQKVQTTNTNKGGVGQNFGVNGLGLSKPQVASSVKSNNSNRQQQNQESQKQKANENVVLNKKKQEVTGKIGQKTSDNTSKNQILDPKVQQQHLQQPQMKDAQGDQYSNQSVEEQKSNNLIAQNETKMNSNKNNGNNFDYPKDGQQQREMINQIKSEKNYGYEYLVNYQGQENDSPITFSKLDNDINKNEMHPVDSQCIQSFNFKVNISEQNSFEDTIKNLLQQRLRQFQINTKEIIYKSYTKSLNESDLETKMRYIRFIDDVTFPSDISKCKFNLEKQLKYQQNIYMYEPPQSSYERHWYVNFADQSLFHFYNSSLFAQDEIQVSEHPLLAHALERAISLSKRFPDLQPKTYSGTNPTPILITNAHRLGTINISPDNEYRNGLYGNNFQKVSEAALKKRMKVLGDQKTVSNIIAMAAMGYQRGVYTKDQIVFTLKTAYKSFLMAKYLTQVYNQKDLCIIHTGNWGCGAFGNNLILIAVIQLIAAQLAGVDQLFYHTFDQTGNKGLLEGINYYQKFQMKMDSIKNPKIDDAVKYLEGLRLKWGVSDGN